VTQLERYLGVHPDLRFVHEVTTAAREHDKGMKSETLASQLLEYAPLRSLPSLQKWLKTNVGPRVTSESKPELRRYYHDVSKSPLLDDYSSYTHRIVATIELSNDFAASKVRILVIHYLSVCAFADSFLIESFTSAQ